MTADDEKDYGWWHRNASENLFQATQEAKRGQYTLALRFLNTAKQSEGRALLQASDAYEKLLALELTHTCDVLIVYLGA